jgi:hypothetical protein
MNALNVHGGGAVFDRTSCNVSCRAVSSLMRSLRFVNGIFEMRWVGGPHLNTWETVWRF